MVPLHRSLTSGRPRAHQLITSMHVSSEPDTGAGLAVQEASRKAYWQIDASCVDKLDVFDEVLLFSVFWLISCGQ